MSGNNSESNYELLSAYLDDALDGSERRQAEHLLATDDLSARYLEQLRANRECLRSLASPSLGSSVTQRVLTQARAAALAAGLPSDHHVLRGASPDREQSNRQASPLEGILIPSSLEQERQASSAHAASTPTSPAHTWTASDWMPRSNRLLWSALATVAAAIICVAVVPNFWTDPAPQPGLSQAIPGFSEPGRDTLAGPLTVPAEEALASGPSSESPGEPERSPFELRDSIAASGGDGLRSGERTPLSARNAVPGGVARVMDGSGAGDALRNDLEASNATIDYLLTVDSVMSPEAWKDGYFDTLLQRIGVPMASPIAADAELTKLLDDSLVSVGSADSAEAADQGKAALIFIRAKGQGIDRLLVALSSDRQHFPKVSYNLAIDSERLLLRQLLRKQVAAQAGEELGARIVRGPQESLVSTRLVPNFVPREPLKASAEGDLGGLSLRALDSLGQASDPVTDVLIILRELPAQ